MARRRRHFGGNECTTTKQFCSYGCISLQYVRVSRRTVALNIGDAMITEMASLDEDMVIMADIAIVGAGPAGIAIALQFANSGFKVVILESGNYDFDTSAQDLAAGTVSGLPYFALDASRYRMIGGSTFLWGARTAPMQPLDFAPREWLGLPGWPLLRTELDAYYDRAYELAGVHRPFEFDAKVWQHVRAEPVAFDAAKFDFSAFQFGRNLLFGRIYREALRKAPNIQVILGATVLGIETNPAASHVTSVEIGHVGGRRAKVAATNFVLAGGGIENARLLLLADSVNPLGLANSNDIVGRYFMEHPTVSAGIVHVDKPNALIDTFSPGLVGGRLVEVGLTLQPEVQRASDSLNAVARVVVETGRDATQAMRELLDNFRHRRLPYQLSWYQKNRWLAERLATIASDPFSIVANSVRHAMGRPLRYKIGAIKLELRTEQEPNPDSRVTLGDTHDAFGLRRPNLHWALTKRDKATMRVLADGVGSELDRLRIGRLEMAPWLARDDLTFGSDMVGGHHHMGTTRMSSDPSQGTVDADCRAHEVDNLFIAGSSVFPTAGFVNPTATLLALSLRLADHLKARQR